MQVPFTAWSPDIRHHTKRQYKPRPRLPEEHAEPAEGPGGDQPAGTGGGRAPSEAGSVRSEGSQRSRRSGGSEASTARGHMVREVVVPQPSRDELGDAHNDPPPGPGHPGRQAAGSGLDTAGAARAGWAAAAPQCRVGHAVGVAGGAGHPPHLLPLPHCAPGGVQPACGAGAGGHVCLPACEWALAGADGGVADRGGGDGDDGWDLWAECAHGLGAAEAGVGGRGMACHARPCGEAAEDGGGG